MTNEKDENKFVIGETVLNGILQLLGEQPLKSGLNIYLQIQQTAMPLESYLDSLSADTEPSPPKDKK